MRELMLRSAGELASLVRSGEVSALELARAALERIEALEPRINAFTYLAGEQALAAAQEIGAGDARPFAGVPIAIKDNRQVAGMPLTMCSDLFGELVSRRDTNLVRRLLGAGFVIIGKTALPEMGLLPTCEPRRHGATANPWDLERTPGGSSGGSAAAVAAGMVPLAHGNDGGGSIRIPASCCGLVGLKPARGRVSVGPEAGESFLVCDGVLTRTVADTAALLDVLAGYEPGDSTWAPAPPEPFAALAGRDPGRLRIALTLDPAIAAELDPACVGAARDAAARLESLGHEVEEVQAPWRGRDLLQSFTKLFGPMVSMSVAAGARLAGRDPRPEDVEPLTWEVYERSRRLSTLDFLGAQTELQSLARMIVRELASFDVVLTPALAQRPLRTGECHGRGPDAWEHFRHSGEFTPYTALVNVTGQPAISLPLYQGEDGLPLAVQLIGAPAREDVLLALATQLEQAQPWSGRVAPLAVAGQ
jgi:amidase